MKIRDACFVLNYSLHEKTQFFPFKDEKHVSTPQKTVLQQMSLSCVENAYDINNTMHEISPQSHDYNFTNEGKLMEGAHITAQTRMIRTTSWISSEANQLPVAACVQHRPIDSLALAERSG